MFVSFIIFLSIPMCYLSADFSVWFRLKRKSREAYDVIFSIKYEVFFLNFVVGGAALQNPPSPHHLVRQCYSQTWSCRYRTVYHWSFSVSARDSAVSWGHVVLLHKERFPCGQWTGRSWVITPRTCRRSGENSSCHLGIQPQLILPSAVA